MKTDLFTLRKVKRILFAFLSLLAGVANAQIQTVFSGISDTPRDFDIVGNNVFLVKEVYDSNDDFTNSYISKIDLSASTLSEQTVIPTINRALRIDEIGGDLYVSIAVGSNQLAKFSPIQSSPSLTTVIDFNSFPFAFDGNDNNIYISNIDVNSTDTSPYLFEIDYTQTTPTATTLLNNISFFVQDVLVDENKVYLADSDGNKILRFDSNTTPTSLQDFITLSVSAAGLTSLAKQGNYIYWAEYNTRKINRVDITQSPLSIEEAVDFSNVTVGTSSVAPETIKFDDMGNLYVLGSYANLYKVEASYLSTKDIKKEEVFSIYPNPTQDFLHINAKPGLSYEIIDAKGALIKKGILKTPEISVKNLSKGIYFLKIENNNVKFIKN